MRHPLYGKWRSMKCRCYNRNDKRFKNYGARGIRVCSQWRESFAQFLADMGPSFKRGLTLERVDNDGNYTPGNCRWATYEDQLNNTRRNRNVTIDGVTRTVSQWSRISQVHTQLIYYRLKRGFDPRLAVFSQSWQCKGHSTTPDRRLRAFRSAPIRAQL